MKFGLMEIKETQRSERDYLSARLRQRYKASAQPIRSTVLPLSQLNPLTQTRDILQFPQIRLLLLSYLLFWTIVILPSSNLPSLVVDRLNWTPEQISPLLVTFGIIVVLMQLVVLPLLLRRFQEIHLAIAGGSSGTVQVLIAVAVMLVALPALQRLNREMNAEQNEYQ